GDEQLLEARDRAAVVVVATDRLGEGPLHGALGDEHVQLVEDARAVLGHRLTLDALQAWVGREGADEAALLGPAPQESLAEGSDGDPDAREVERVARRRRRPVLASPCPASRSWRSGR